MKISQNQQNDIEHLLDLNNIINDYIGKRKPANVQSKPGITVKPLKVFDINFLNENKPKTHLKQSSTLMPSTEKNKSKTISSALQDSLKNNIKAVEKKNYIHKYQRVQSAKIANKVIPKQNTVEVGLIKKHCSSLDNRRKIQAKMMLKNRYQMSHIIGRGAFSIVYKARDILTNKLVAIKIINESDSLEPKLFRHLDHRNIIKYITVFTLNEKIHMVFQFYEQTLNSYMKQRRDETEIKQIFKQLCRAVEYIHTIGIVHRDIKLQNILVQTNDKDASSRICVKLIDFGLAVKIDQFDHKLNSFKDFCGTPNYVAPEIVNGEKYEGKPADCWALGVVLYFMLVGRYPFKSKQETQLYKKIKKGKICYPEFISEKAKKLINNLLKAEPLERYNIHQILLDSWFQ